MEEEMNMNNEEIKEATLAEERKNSIKKFNKEQLYKYSLALIDENEDLINQCVECEDRARDAETKSNDYLTRLSSLKGDFDRFKNRNREVAEEAEERGKLSSIEKIFPILDTFDRAAASTNVAELEVVKLILKQFEGVLRDLGIEEMDVLDKPFDPNTSYAVIETPASTEEQKHTVTGIVSKGYAYKGKVLRYPKVVVAV